MRWNLRGENVVNIAILLLACLIVIGLMVGLIICQAYGLR
jgi:hypothetical protein